MFTGLLLLAAPPATADPVLDYGFLLIYHPSVAGSISNAVSFTTDGVSDFSGGSDSISNQLEYAPVGQARWGDYASGHVDLSIISESEQDYDYQQFGTYRANSQIYSASANLLYGFDERYDINGVDDTYQYRRQYEFSFSFEIRWHHTNRGIEPKLRLISGPAFTTAYGCQRLIGLQGGCASSSPGTVGPLFNLDNKASIIRADGSGDWTLDMEITLTRGVFSETARYSFPLLGHLKEIARGSLAVSIENEIPVDAKTSIDEAVITLIRQSDYLRGQGPEETPAAYQAYLDARTRFAVESRPLAAGSGGTVTFSNVPFYGLGRRSSSTPIWYSVFISAGQTEEIDLNQDPVDPNITTTTFFIPELNTNLRPSEAKPPTVHNFPITPTDALGAKNVLIPEVRRGCMTQYKAAEDAMQAGLDAYLASPGTMTSANIEGIKRVLWAERVVRSAADFSDDASKVAMEGLATVIGDLFDDFTSPKRADLKKRSDELKAINAGAGTKPLAFYTDLGMSPNQAIEAMKLDNILLEGEIADVIKGAIKVLKQSYVDRCIEVGNDADDCKGDAKAFTLVAVSVLNAMSTRTVRGAAKSGLKAVIEEVVKAAKGPLFDSYCSSTEPDLNAAVTRGLAWSTFSKDDYRDEAAETADILRKLSDSATLIGKAEAIQIAAGGLDRTGDALGVLAIGAKPVAILEKAVKVSKYVYNGVAIVLPMVFIISARTAVEEGTLAAFGLDPPSKMSSGLKTTAGVHASGGPTFSALNARATNLMAAEWAIRLPLGNDDIPGAIQAAADTSNPNAYVNHLAAWTLEVELFKATITATQATGTIGDLLSAFMVADAQLKLAHAKMLADLRELLVAIDTVTYESPTSRDYLVHRNSINSQLFLIRNKVERFVDVAGELDLALVGQPVAPFVFSHVTSLESLDTGEEIITQSPDEFALTVRLENMSSTALNNLKARLVVYSPKGSVTMITSSDVAVGTLAGGATTDATWQFDYDGDLSDELIRLRIEVLENDQAPASFDFNEPHTNVFVDPAISDQDGDHLPDDWERTYGLDTALDDSGVDLDLDGLSHLTEYFYGLDPTDSDSDDDGVSDGDELLGNNNGFLTDPLDPDSDADLVNDGTDSQPLDASITASSPPAEKGLIQLSTNSVVLTSTNLFETVIVSNIGSGPITWSTTVDNDAVALATPRDPKMITEDGAVGITVPSHFDFDQAYLTRTTVHVFDVAYPKNGPQDISVVIIGDNYDSSIFADGFESGNTTAWSTTNP